ncbi:rhomboid family protein [bacterium BMS3Bbin12]|nr:rhomboid family protein [bacterium BMS3Abin12]GBE47006.1 rhomboid family protein [bacterium BMS3Bbin12]GBE49511.1 rhomboid family protein [bacterium BMS3Bbin13]
MNYVFPGLLLALTVVLQAFAPHTTLALRYDRAAVAGGEVWRLITGNLVHLNWPHLLLNLAGLVLIWVLLAREWSFRFWCAAFLICALAVGGGLFAFDPALQWYVGLSGVLHGLFVIALLTEPHLRWFERVGLLAALAAKIAWEQFHGPTPGVTELIHGAVVVQAHLYGALGGAVFGAGAWLGGRTRGG